MKTTSQPAVKSDAERSAAVGGDGADGAEFCDHHQQQQFVQDTRANAEENDGNRKKRQDS